MLDHLYENVGSKVKNLAKYIFVIESITAVISGISLLASDESLILVGLLTIILGPVVAYISSLVLYAIGESAENASPQKPSMHSATKVTTTANCDAKNNLDISNEKSSQEEPANFPHMEKPVGFEFNEKWEKSLKTLPSKKLLERYLDQGNYSDTYRYSCYLELQNRNEH